MRRLVIEENCPDCGRWEPHDEGHGWFGPLRTVLTEPTDKIVDVMEFEKMVAVTLRREWPDLLPTTDAWRSIAQRACQIIEEQTRWGPQPPPSHQPPIPQPQSPYPIPLLRDR
jgi:hypothetical protein